MNRNPVAIVNKIKGKINLKYDMKLGDIALLKNNCDDYCRLYIDLFSYGYAQGFKACKAELKKAGAK